MMNEEILSRKRIKKEELEDFHVKSGIKAADLAKTIIK